ncbi:DUF2505 domain-containing protein [Nocardia tengchongensis]|uniref:DUF2505 domain-containing protein n=1 Tax=Nocardia tengchongensis TaxID=2055889 RepID=UPI0036AAA9CE
MAQKIRLISEFPFSARHFHDAMVSPEYWRARVAELDGPVAELSIRHDSGDLIATVSKPLAPDRIPPRLSKAWPAGLRLDYSERWSPFADGEARAEVRAAISAIGSMSGTFELRDGADGCVCEYVVTVESGIPMAGRLIAGAFAKGVIEDSGAVDAFTERWLKSRGVEVPGGA